MTWLYLLDVYRTLFQAVTSRHLPSLLSSSLNILANLYGAAFHGNVEVSTINQVYIFDTLGSALRIVGVRTFLSIIPLTEPADPSPIPIPASREWILNLLQNNLKLMPCALEDFLTVILPIARKCVAAGALPHVAGDSTQLSIARTRVIQLWSLFPGFCYYGVKDVSATLPKLLVSIERGLQDDAFPEISSHVTSGLTHLINCTKLRPSSATDLPTLQSAASTLFSAILKLTETLDPVNPRFTSCIQCIEALASVSPYPLLSAVAKKLIELLLASTASKDDAHDSSTWLSILLALIPYLKENLIVIIYRTIRPLLSVKETSQKRAYLVLDSLLKHHYQTVHAFEPRMAILSLLSQYLLTCSVNARHMRLRCMGTLISTFEEQAELQNAAGVILSEILLCLKDSNKKCRLGAIEVLELLMNRVDLDFFISLLSAAMSSSNPSHHSPAVTALCMLILERRHDPAMLRYADNLLPTVLGLQSEGASGENVKAVLSYLKVIVSVLPVDLIEGIVPEIVDAATRSTSRSKHGNKVRGLLRKLSQRVDPALLRPHMYEPDVPLLDHLMKEERRSKRKKETVQQKDRVDMILDSDSDSDDESEEETGKEKPRKRVKAIRATADTSSGIPLTLEDFMTDQRLASSQGSFKSKSSQKKSEVAMGDGDVPIDEDQEYKVVVAEDGRVIVETRAVRDSADIPALDTNEATKRDGKSEKVVSRKRVREPGEEYRAKKAGGDVWKLGQMEPHAYIPLDPRLLSKKNSKEALSQLGSVIRNRNKKPRGGAAIGMKSHVIVGNRKQRLAAKKSRNGQK